MNRRTRTLLACVCLVTALTPACVPAAFAAGTGDDPTPTQDVLSQREAAARARMERQTEELLERSTSGRAKDGIGTYALDGPYRYLWTPSHKQERNYWCGPATSQIIDHYFGTYVSQSTYADFMGTSTAGSDFSLMDDCLRHYTGKSYYYYGSLTDSAFGSRVLDSIMNHGMPVAADVNIIASIWPNYVRDHPGHIVPIEAFDWRYSTLRLNDPFNEGDTGGGTTFGHTTYDRAVVWNGVYNHFRRAVVSAP